jgi:hypothetical protein
MSLINPFETILHQFIDKIIIQKQDVKTKTELISLWNDIYLQNLNNTVKSSVPDHTVKSSFPEHTVKSSVPEHTVKSSVPEHTVKSSVPEHTVKKSISDDDKCKFIITRGEHLGTRCKSRCKNDSEYCLKHQRDKK